MLTDLNKAMIVSSVDELASWRVGGRDCVEHRERRPRLPPAAHTPNLPVPGEVEPVHVGLLHSGSECAPAAQTCGG